MNIGFLSLYYTPSNSSKDETNCIPDDGVSSRILCRSEFLLLGLLAQLTNLTHGQGVFGMNIKDLVNDTKGTLAHYFAVAISLTLTTIWVIVAFQSKDIYPEGTSLWVRFGWPGMLAMNLLKSRFGKIEKQLPIKKGIKDESHW